MDSHRRKWGWWLVAAIAVAVAASLFFHRKPACPSEQTGQPEASAPVAGAEPSVPVVRDTVFIAVEGNEMPVVRERPAPDPVPDPASKPAREQLPESAPSSESVPTPAPVPAETVVEVPVEIITGLLRSKSGRDINLTTQAPDRMTLTYAGKVDIPVVGQQVMNLSASFRIIEAKDDRLVLKLDSGTAKNVATELVAPLVLDRLPAGVVESFSANRVVVNLSAIPQFKEHLADISLTSVTVDDRHVRIGAIKK